MGAILNGSMFLIALFFMPETIFDRPADETVVEDSKLMEKVEEHNTTSISSLGETYHPPHMEFKTYLRRMWLWDLDRPSSRKMKGSDFVVKPLSMLKYPSVAFPTFYLYDLFLAISPYCWLTMSAL